MMKDLKFRRAMLREWKFCFFKYWGKDIEHASFVAPGQSPSYEAMEDQQFTGHQIKGINLYEGDIVRLEENGDGINPDDKMTWYVVTWIKEWCMFALLRVEDEYPEYMNEGTDALDTTMFWTFPLDVEDIGPSQYYLCGNIWQNPELLTPSI